jgi:hypothetical protein
MVIGYPTRRLLLLLLLPLSCPEAAPIFDTACDGGGNRNTISTKQIRFRVVVVRWNRTRRRE